MIIGTKQNDYLVGSDDTDDLIFGLEGDDVLSGKGGNDWINGGPGGDHMYGGAGNDSYFVDSRDDLVVEMRGEGYDFVHASISYTLPNNVEGLMLEGAGAINGIGNNLDNYMYGNSSSNVLWGLGGDDVIDGKGGADLMFGGLGDDTFYVDDANDTIFEYLGEGDDWVYASLNYTLPDNVENLVLIDGGTALNGTGNELPNRIYGNIADNMLSGGDGHDILDGGIGADTMKGGNDGDTYYVDNVGDKVIEESALGGVDSVGSSISYALGTFVENLYLLDSGGAIDGTGNELDNVIHGNAYSNVLTGGDGNDQFYFRNDPQISEYDTITDFHAGDAYGDVIMMDGYNLVGGFAELLPYLSQVGNDVVGTFDSFNGLTLKNVQLSDLNANDFLFLN
jgi:Ca2+-binding RTX toxin-like protein